MPGLWTDDNAMVWRARDDREADAGSDTDLDLWVLDMSGYANRLT